ncbi:Lysine N-acyltransferase MbtK OS=Streptomyces tendae OX=1932 GN=GUR47_08535 PE=3 SV=1 [Streptomyces tendae]
MSTTSTTRTTRTAAGPDAARVGDLTLRPVDPLKDAVAAAPLAHAPQGRVLDDAGRRRWRTSSARTCELAADEHHHASARPARRRTRVPDGELRPRGTVELVGLYEPEPGDVGMHFLVAPTDRPVHGFTRAVITAVMAELFADPATRRVVVEPDVANTAVHALNAAVGFVPEREIQKPEKKALLSFCTREQFEEAVSA